MILILIAMVVILAVLLITAVVERKRFKDKAEEFERLYLKARSCFEAKCDAYAILKVDLDNNLNKKNEKFKELHSKLMTMRCSLSSELIFIGRHLSGIRFITKESGMEIVKSSMVNILVRYEDVIKSIQSDIEKAVAGEKVGGETVGEYCERKKGERERKKK